MRIRQIVGLLAVLLLVLVGCGTQGEYVPPTLHVERDGEVLSALELRAHQGESVQLDLVVTGSGTIEYIIEEPAQPWLKYNAYTSGVATLKTGERRTIELEYQCGPQPYLPTEFIIRVVDGDDIVLPARLLGCEEPGDPEAKVIFKHGDKVVEGLTFTQAGATSITIENQSVADVSFELSSLDSWLAIDDSITGMRTLAAKSSLDLPISYTCESAGGPQASAIKVDFDLGTMKTLPVELTGCVADPVADPDADLQFVDASGFDVDALSVGLEDSPASVTLVNRGLASIDFVLVSADSSLIGIGASAGGPQSLGPDGELEIPLRLTCGANTSDFTVNLDVMDGGNFLKALPVTVTGCVADPHADPSADLKFTYLDSGRTTVSFDVNETPTVFLENVGQVDITAEMTSNGPELSIDNSALGSHTIAAGGSIPVPLTFECGTEISDFTRTITVVDASGFASGSLPTLDVQITGCQPARTGAELAEDLQFVDDGGFDVSALTVALGDSPLSVTLENRGTAPIDFVLSSTDSDLVAIGASAGGPQSLAPNGELVIPLRLACGANTSEFTESLEIWSASGFVEALPVTVTGCVADPVAEPVNDLKFTYLGSARTTVSFDVNETPTVFLENAGQVDIDAEMASSHSELIIDNSALGSHTIPAGGSIPVPLTFECGAKTDTFARTISIGDIDGWPSSALPSLTVEITGCVADPVADPDADLSFVYRGGVVDDTEVVSFSISDADSIFLVNDGDVSIDFTLATGQPTRVLMDPDVLYGRSVDSHSSFEIPLSFTCDGWDTPFDAEITASVNNSVVRTFNMSVTGCEPAPEPEDFVVFTHNDEVVSGLTFAGDGATTVYLENRGNTDVSFTLSSLDAWLRIDSVITGTRNLAAGASLELPLLYTCDVAGTQSSAIDAEFAPGSSIVLGLEVTDCVAPLEDHEALVFVVDNEEIDHLKLDTNQNSMDITLRNIGSTTLSFTLTTDAGWMSVAGQNVGTLHLDGGDERVITLNYDCVSFVTLFTGVLSANFSGGDPSELNISLPACDVPPADPAHDLRFLDLNDDPIASHGLAVDASLVGSATVKLISVGTVPMNVELRSSDPARIELDNTIASNTHLIDPSGTPLDVTLWFECGSATAPFTEWINVFADGDTTAALVLPVTVNGCTEPTASDPSTDLKFYNAAGTSPIAAHGLSVPYSPNTVDVKLVNDGPNSIYVELASSNASQVMLDNTVGPFGHNLESGDELDITLWLSCSTANTTFTQWINVFADGDTTAALVLPVEVTGCTEAATADPSDDLKFYDATGNIPLASHGPSFDITFAQYVEVQLANTGTETTYVELLSSDASRVTLDDSVAPYGHMLGSGNAITVGLWLACGSTTTTFSESISVFANGDPTAALVLPVEVTGCVAPPAPAPESFIAMEFGGVQATEILLHRTGGTPPLREAVTLKHTGPIGSGSASFDIALDNISSIGGGDWISLIFSGGGGTITLQPQDTYTFEIEFLNSCTPGWVPAPQTRTADLVVDFSGSTMTIPITAFNCP